MKVCVLAHSLWNNIAHGELKMDLLQDLGLASFCSLLLASMLLLFFINIGWNSFHHSVFVVYTAIAKAVISNWVLYFCPLFFRWKIGRITPREVCGCTHFTYCLLSLSKCLKNSVSPQRYIWTKLLFAWYLKCILFLFPRSLCFYLSCQFPIIKMS